MKEEEVWVAAMAVTGFDGMTPKEFDSLREGLEKNPESVSALVRSANSKDDPDLYFRVALRRRAEEGWEMMLRLPEELKKEKLPPPVPQDPVEPEIGEDGLTDAARRWRAYQMKRGVDPRRFTGGPTRAEESVRRLWKDEPPQDQLSFE